MIENAVKELIAMVSQMEIDMITELHMAIATKSEGWGLDSRAIIHVCHDKAFFKSYEELKEFEEVLIGNHNAPKVVKKGSVELKFTCGKKLSLLNVFHIPNLKKNFVFANLLCEKDFKVVLDSDKVVITKNGVFVGKRYTWDGMFKFSINEINNSFAYVVNCSFFYMACKISTWPLTC